MFAVELEHALQPRLMNRADACISQLLADLQAERSFAFQSARRQLLNSLNPGLVETPRKEDAGASHAWVEELDCEAELIDKYEPLRASIDEQRLELIAHRRERQRIEAHSL